MGIFHLFINPVLSQHGHPFIQLIVAAVSAVLSILGIEHLWTMLELSIAPDWEVGSVYTVPI